MNFLNKLERKIGKYAIPHLIIYLLGAYCIGFALMLINPTVLLYLNFQPHLIFQGQVWRVFTWIFQPTDSNILFLAIMMFFYYQLGTALERAWGTFRFNAYIIGGMLLTVAGSLLAYGIIFALCDKGMAIFASEMMGGIISTNWINMSIFLAFAALYPNMQILLMFIIPVKMKWMAFLYVGLIGVNLLEAFKTISYLFGAKTALWYTGIMFLSIALSLINFLIFFLTTRNYKRVSPKEIHRKQVFKAQMREPRGGGITKHKCAVCGRTEQDDPTLEFRFCSKCEGNYEYCQDHLFTHQHIKRS